MQEVVIVSAARTPIGAYCGMLRDVPVESLGAIVLNEAIKRANLKPDEVDEVIMGQSFPNGESPMQHDWPFSRPGGLLKSPVLP